MSAIARKINLGIAAGALAAAATLTPVSVANAAPVIPAPQAGLANSVGAECDETSTTPCFAPMSIVYPDIDNFGPIPILQNNLWWFGAANPNPPARSNILVFTPLTLIPGFLKPAYSWFTQRINIEACVFGGSVKVGPYGTTTVSVGNGCA